VATVILEEGSYWRRRDFSGRPLEMFARLYRDRGFTATVGNCFIPVPMGRCVGGTTTINSGTCYRTPERVLRKWREAGLSAFTAEEMEPYYARVESVLQVARAERRYLGGIADAIGRGCDALGLPRHGPLARNAPDCDGASLCCFGCPTDAKRSANVSYVPLALRAGANLYYNATVEQVLVEQGRAAGVVARTARGRLTVRARAVALACGTLMTPALLLRQRLCNSSGELGKNLSLHPALAPFALFPRDAINGAMSIPQGYAIEQFHDEGLLFENVFVPPDMGAGALTFFGQRFTEVMEQYNHVAAFGFLIEDTSRGRVRLGPGGRPYMTYFMNDHDVARLKRGLEILFRVYLAAGAEVVFPMVPGFVEVRDQRDIDRFRRASFRARDFELTAHHPLGTARMGRDRRSSVVGPTHEAHDLPGLFICDGSALPSSLGVNPQVTIMALATRAAQFVARAVG
jgi:choline dehydrogenase-like flavoprotein